MKHLDPDLERIMSRAIRDLASGLQLYWPAVNDNEMPEAHTLGAIGRSLSEEGFHVFHEVWCDPGGHVDLVGICPERSTCVVFEGKRLYDGRGATSLFDDWQRLGTTQLAKQYGAPNLRNHFRGLVGSSWQPNIREWWLGTHDTPTGRRSRAWRDLRRATTNCVLRGGRIQTDAKWGEQWLLYAYGRRHLSFF